MKHTTCILNVIILDTCTDYTDCNLDKQIPICSLFHVTGKLLGTNFSGKLHVFVFSSNN